MIRDTFDFSDWMQRVMPEVSSSGLPKTPFTFTFQVTTDCSLRCTYCYQINKGHEMMTWDVAKKVVDYIFDSAEDPNSVLSYDKASAIIIDFFGGEPLLNIDLITQIIDYCEVEFIRRESPWLFKHRYSFSSNGVAYFDDKVQQLLAHYGDLISLGITVDGYKELHDRCRVFPDGSGSYDKAIAASLHQKDVYHLSHSKVTLCPENIDLTAKAVINMLELGYNYIHANCVFEEGWTVKDAKILYDQMKIIGNYVLDHDLEDKCGVSLYGTDICQPIVNGDAANWCGGTGQSLAVDYKGDFFPCIRYMESSLGNDQPPLVIGNIDTGGPYAQPKEKAILEEFKQITRQSQSPPECLVCPVAKGCAWCSGYNYQKFGTANKRATFICIMHKAQSLGNFYYLYYESLKKHIPNPVKLYLPKEEAIKIIGKEEADFLYSLQKEV